MQQSRFMAIMNNYDRTLQLIKVSTNSAGAAQQQYATYTDSVEAAQNRMNNSIEKFNVNLMKPENVKAFYNTLADLIGLFAEVPPLVTLIIAGLAAYITKTYLLVGAIKLKTLAQKMANNEEIIANKEMSKSVQWIYKKIGGDMASTAVTWKMVIAQTAYNAALTMGISLIIAGVTWLISSIATGKERVEVLKEEVATLNEKSAASLQEATNLENLIQRYKDLNSIVGKTVAQQDELKSIIDQILEISPNLLSSIDAEGQKRLKSNQQLDEELKKKRELAILDAEAATTKTVERYSATTDWENVESMTDAQKTRYEEIQKIRNQLLSATGDSKVVEDVFNKLEQGVYDSSEEFNIAIEEALTTAGQKVTDEQYLKFKFTGVTKTAEEWINELTKEYGSLPKKIENRLKEEDTLQPEVGMSIQEIIDKTSLWTEETDFSDQFAKEVINKSDKYFESQLVFLDDMLSSQIADVQGQVAGLYAQKASQFVSGKTDVSDVFLTGIQDMTKYVADQLKIEATDNNLVGEKAADHITNNLQEQVDIMYEALTKFESSPEQTKVAEASKTAIASIIESGASKETIGKTIEEERRKLEAANIDTKIIDLVISSVFNERAFNDMVATITQNDSRFIDKIEKYSKGTIEMLSGAMNSGNQALIDAIANSNAEQQKAVDEAYQAFLKDPNSAQATENFIQAIAKNFSVTEDVAKDYISGLQTIGTGALENIKTIYEQLNKTTDYLKKSMSGALDLKTAIELMNTPGYEGAVSFGTEGQAVVDGVYLVNKAREQEAEIVANIENEIGELNKTARTATGEQLQGITRQIDAWRNLQENIKKTTLIEQGLIDNQDVVASVSMINSSVNSLKDYADVFQKIKAGGMSFLDVMEEIGKNPDLLFALESTENGIRFNEDALKDLAKAKIDETKAFLTGERDKLQAIANVLAFELGMVADVSQADKDLAKQAIDEYDSQLTQVKTISDAQAEASRVKIENTQKEIDAEYELYLQTLDTTNAKREQAGLGPIGAETKRQVDTTQIAKADIDLLGMVETLRSKFNLGKGLTDNEIKRSALTKINEEINKMNGMLTELDKLEPNVLFNEIGKAAGGAQKDFEQFNGEVEKFYNILNRISELQSQVGSLDSLISLDKTGGREDVRLLEQKGKKLAELLAYQEALSKSRRNDLKKQQEEIKKYYSGYVTFVNDQMTVNEDLINSLVITNDAQKMFYENMKKGIDEYKSSYEEFLSLEQELLDIKRQQEEMYNEIINKAIDTRQQIYDALVESDQREIDQLTEKYDKMKQLEDDYLNAVKKSIDEERAARDTAQKAEDLAQKKRRLAILERDTSGLYASEAAKIQEEISKDEQAARDAQVDAQMKALEEQIKLQQEQRDTQIKLLEDQKLFREETGYYWDRVDEAIQNGPAAMQDLLTSTQEYQQADPLSQQQQYEQIKSSTEYLAELVEKGIGINGNQHNIVGAITSAATEIANALGQKINAENISANANGGGGGGSNQTPTSPASSTPKQTVEQQYNQGTSTNLIKTLQTFLNNYLGAKLSVDGIAGDKTDSFMNGLWDNAIRQALNQGKTGFASIFQNAKSTKQISSTAKSALVSLYGSRYNMIPTVKYKEGGIVDFTGPAWVDGTSGSPEAFLNARQTAIFEGLRDYLTTPLGSNMLGSNNISNSTSIGDIVINLQNSTGASAKDIADQVKKELTNIMVTKNTLSIQKVR